ncbi:10255_t:CDS:2 [Entrophospora sp. SA101]|nr:10255_t:CDS:2 [Entrophospora sp. SA101]
MVVFASGTHYAISLSWIATSVWRPYVANKIDQTPKLVSVRCGCGNGGEKHEGDSGCDNYGNDDKGKNNRDLDHNKKTGILGAVSVYFYETKYVLKKSLQNYPNFIHKRRNQEEIIKKKSPKNLKRMKKMKTEKPEDSSPKSTTI